LSRRVSWPLYRLVALPVVHAKRDRPAVIPTTRLNCAPVALSAATAVQWRAPALRPRGQARRVPPRGRRQRRVGSAESARGRQASPAATLETPSSSAPVGSSAATAVREHVPVPRPLRHRLRPPLPHQARLRGQARLRDRARPPHRARRRDRPHQDSVECARLGRSAATRRIPRNCARTASRAAPAGLTRASVRPPRRRRLRPRGRP